MRITCCGCLHGHYPELEEGDLLIVTGDLTARDTIPENMYFAVWLCKQKYRKKIVISGNHDKVLENGYLYAQGYTFKTIDGEGLKFDYLCDSGTEFEGLKIWGSPWSLSFPGINPHCTAFTGTEEDLKKAYDKIPDKIDILITHTPPYGILDKNYNDHHCGSIALRNVMRELKPRLMVFSHIHECGGRQIDLVTTKLVNCSIMNERYQPINKPVRIEL